MEKIIEDIVAVAKSFRADGNDEQAAEYLRFQPPNLYAKVFTHVITHEDLSTAIFVKQAYGAVLITFNQILSVFKKNPSVGPWLVENASGDVKEESLIFAITTKNNAAYECLRSQKDIDLTCRSGAVLLAASSSSAPNVIEDIIHHFSKEDRICALHWAEPDVPTLNALLKHQIVEDDNDKVAIQKGLNAVLIKSVQNKNAALVEFLAPLCDIPAVFQTLSNQESNTEALDQYCSNQQKSLLMNKIKTVRATSIENEAPIRKM